MTERIDPQMPIVFLHAFPLHSGMWTEQVALFRDRRTLAPDLPGFGGRPAGASTMEEFARAVLVEMDAAGIERAAVVGLSMGGYVAFRLWEIAPERIRALVLADTRAGPDAPEAAAGREEQARRARAEGIGWLPDAMLPKVLGETTLRERPEVVERVRGMMESADPEGVARALLAMRERPDSGPLLATIDVPVLVIVGAEDELTPVAEGRAIADGVGLGRLEVLSGAGHLSNLEAPAEWERALRGFL
jgi:3-oxoadipate enol-lactonase